MLELGGAVVNRWTLQHLLDQQSIQNIDDIIGRPSLLRQQEFNRFLDINNMGYKVTVIAHIYIGDYLTKRKPPSVARYDGDGTNGQRVGDWRHGGQHADYYW